MDRFIVLDLETTGFSPETSEIIEIGAWKIDNGIVVEKFCRLIKPVGYVQRDIQELTGITNEMLSSECCLEEVLPEFYEFCGDFPFLGHNLDFDYRFLCVKGNYMGYDFSLKKTRMGIDTYKLAKKYLTSLHNHKLQTVSEFFKINIPSSNLGFHRAEYDAYITKLVYDRFRYLYSNLAGVLVPVLLDKQDKTEYGKVVCDDTLSFT